MRSSAGVYLLLAVATLFLCACENDIATIKQITNIEKLPDQAAKTIEIVYTDSGFVQAKIVAPVLNRFIGEKSQTVFPKGAKVYFYDKSMNITSSISGDHAVYKELEQVIEAKGNIIAVNTKGEQLNTEALTWDQSKEKLSSKEFVKITTADKIIFGQGFESDQSLTNYKIFNIKGTINIDKKDAKGT